MNSIIFIILQLHQFFDELTLPPVSAEPNNLLGNAEILQTINSLKCNKTPGPDKYTSKSYKQFALELCPLFKAMFNKSRSLGYLRQTLW